MSNIDTNKDIKKLRRVLLLIAKDVAKLCDEHDIKYSLSGGSQLGAVRHHGFIPWDDDMDLEMKREEYEKFLIVCDKYLDKSKYLLLTSKWENYPFEFAKIQLKGTEIIEDFSKNADVPHGIFIDIFPYDNLPDSKYKRKSFLLKNHLLKNILWVKCGYGSEEQKRSIKFKLFKILGLFSSKRKLKVQRKKLITKYNNVDTQYCFASDYPDQFLKNEWFEHTKKYKFEDTEFWGLEDYDSYLKALYGDYMKIPPVEQRETHTHYKINFGKYANM